jgi:hypothetical protein
MGVSRMNSLEDEYISSTLAARLIVTKSERHGGLPRQESPR